MNFSILTDISPLTMTPFDYPHWYAGLSIIRDIGDVNSDGIDDIYVFDRSGDFTDYVSYTSILAGNTSLDFTELFSSESLWGAIDIGKDLNADGYPEAIVMDAIQVTPDSAYWLYDLITLNPDYSIVDEAEMGNPKYNFLSVYPNPFNSSLDISYQLPKEVENLAINIYNMSGSLVWSFERAGVEAGYYSETWDGTDANAAASSGVYLIRMRADEKNVSRKAILLK